jgi:anti-sigma regulatory factor (Ser/Thr protein kinase)
MRSLDELRPDVCEYHIRIETKPDTLRMTRKLVRAAAIARGAADAVAGEIELAVGEALANAYEHAYGGAPGPLEVKIACAGERFVIEVRNHGRSITPPKIPHDAPTGQRGRGLYLIERMMDEVRVIHPAADGRGTALVMTKRIS